MTLPLYDLPSVFEVIVRVIAVLVPVRRPVSVQIRRIRIVELAVSRFRKLAYFEIAVLRRKNPLIGEGCPQGATQLVIHRVFWLRQHIAKNLGCFGHVEATSSARNWLRVPP